MSVSIMLLYTTVHDSIPIQIPIPKTPPSTYSSTAMGCDPETVIVSHFAKDTSTLDHPYSRAILQRQNSGENEEMCKQGLCDTSTPSSTHHSNRGLVNTEGCETQPKVQQLHKSRIN